MNYTGKASGGATILKYQLQINSSSIKQLRSAPFNLINGIPTLFFGFIPIQCIFALDVTAPATLPVFIGNSNIIGSLGAASAWNSIDLDQSTNFSAQQNYILQAANNNSIQLTNAERNYQPSGNLTPGTNIFELYCTANEPAADWGGIFTVYYLDAPLY